jgi:hypothetical protein
MRKPNYDLAQDTWEDARRFYSSQKNNPDCVSIRKLIDKVIDQGINRILFASNSHALLNVSPHDKYDAHCDLLRFECESGKFLVEYFEYVGDDRHELQVMGENVSREQAFDLMKENVERLEGSVQRGSMGSD